jgi:hypothetical protein
LLKRATATGDGNTEESCTVSDWDLVGGEPVDMHVGTGVGSLEVYTASVDEALVGVALPVNPWLLDINAKNSDGATALIVACANGHAKVVCELLKSKEVDVKAKTVAGETCHALASRNGHADVACMLQEHENEEYIA